MHRRRFPLEQAYRKTYHSGLIDLSSSTTVAPTLADLLDSDELAAMAGQTLAYEPGGGSLALRSAVASLYDGIDADNVVITAGALEAIRAVAMAAVCPGDRVLVQEPAYDAMRQAVSDAGGVVVPWRIGEADASIDAPCDLAFINSPHGPTGAILRDLQRFNGRIVVDEVYRPIALNGITEASCIESIPGSVAIGDLSKPLGLGGLRIGWIVSRDLELLERCADAVDYLSGSVSALSARVALCVLPRFDELLAPRLESARRNLMRLAAFVEANREIVDWTPPQAGYTAALRARSGSINASLFENLRARGLFLLEGAVFGMPDYLRIGLGLAPETFDAGLEALGCELRRTCGSPQEAPQTADVILYTKVPRPGEGKSRLASGIGIDNAAALASAFLHDTLEAAARESRRLFVALATIDGVAELGSALPCAEVFEQRGADMGQRLNAAFEDAIARGATNPILIGSDSPTLPWHLLTVASRTLETHDVVIGPATDGGYYLIGLKQPQPSLFNDIDWSTERTLQQTLDRAASAGLSVFVLPPWYDVDTKDDLARLRLDAHPSSATAEALRTLV